MNAQADSVPLLSHRVFLLSIVSMVVSGTVVHLAQEMKLLQVHSHQTLSTITEVSMITSTRKLFTAPPYTFDLLIPDLFKHIIIYLTINGHALSCIAIPLGFYLLRMYLLSIVSVTVY